MMLFFGKYDSIMGWREKVEFMNKAQEMRIGGFYFWDTSTHGLGGMREWMDEFVYRYTTLFQYRADQSYPAVSYLSINDDPGDGDMASGDSVGTYGGYVEWFPWTITDEPGFYEIYMSLATRDSVITLPADTATAVITLRRLQNFEIHPDWLYCFVNIDAATWKAVQRVYVKPDSLGLLSVEGVKLSTNGHWLSFYPVSSTSHNEVLQLDSVP